MNVASIKHAHHHFDPDQPGKDSVGAIAKQVREMIISSARAG